MTGQYIICELPELTPIEGADRIVQATIFGETVIISSDHKQGEKGLLFDCETVLSKEYLHNNNLYRHSHLNNDPEKQGYFDDNGRVRPIRLKGVKVSGFWMPLSSVDYCGVFPSEFKVGEQGNNIGGQPICMKYITPASRRVMNGKEGKARVNLTPTFKEHIDTDQLARNLDKVKGSVIITEKLHGTSSRCGNLPVIRKKSWFERLINLLGIPTLETEYKFVVGSRRTVKSIDGTVYSRAGFYAEDIWTSTAKEHFEDKLEKGETVYYEIVGNLPSDIPIMPSQSNKKLEKFMSKKDYEEFIKLFGEFTDFTYNCEPSECQIYVYRITMTNEDGVSIDYSWEQVKNRSEQLGVKHVPHLLTIHTDPENENSEFVMEIADKLSGEHSKNFPNHIREGVCIRIEDGKYIPTILKHKSYIFKVLEGIIKDSKDVIDLEEVN